MQSVKEQGVTIIYISHRMEEVFEISDRVSILRDGKYIGTSRIGEVSTQELINMMVGRELANRFPEKSNEPGDVILDVQHMNGKYTRLKEARSPEEFFANPRSQEA